MQTNTNHNNNTSTSCVSGCFFLRARARQFRVKSPCVTLNYPSVDLNAVLVDVKWNSHELCVDGGGGSERVFDIRINDFGFLCATHITTVCVCVCVRQEIIIFITLRMKLFFLLLNMIMIT